MRLSVHDAGAARSQISATRFVVSAAIEGRLVQREKTNAPTSARVAATNIWRYRTVLLLFICEKDKRFAGLCSPAQESSTADERLSEILLAGVAFGAVVPAITCNRPNVGTQDRKVRS